MNWFLAVLSGMCLGVAGCRSNGGIIWFAGIVLLIISGIMSFGEEE